MPTSPVTPSPRCSLTRRDVFTRERLHLNHPDPEVVKYARAELADICKAVGVLKPADSVQLHNLPLVVTVKVAPRKDNGELQNRIRGYARKEAAAGQPQQAPATSTTPPWRR